MVSWTMRTARSLSSAGCWCPDPCLGVCCFDADMGYILPKNAASIKPRAVHCADLLTARFRVRIPTPEPISEYEFAVAVNYQSTGLQHLYSNGTATPIRFE